MPDEENEELIYRNNRELHYSFDPEKGFVARVDFQYHGNQAIIRQGWDAAEYRLKEVSEKISAGKLSPLAWHMEKNLMELPMLSAYTGIMKWRIKRHLKPKNFNTLKQGLLARYASVFNITIEELKKPALN